MENPFAPLPVGAVSPSGAVWREGDGLCTTNGATWPCRCAVCGQTTGEDNPLRLQLQWHPRWIFFLIILSFWFYLIAMLFTRRTAAIHIFLCDEHMARRKNGMAPLFASLAIGIVGIFAGVGWDQVALMGMGLLVLLGGVIAGSLMMRTVWATRIDNDQVWVKAGRGFMETVS